MRWVRRALGRRPEGRLESPRSGGQATALLGTIAAVVFALASDVSPAGAALRGGGSGLHSSGWPAGVAVWAAVFLLLVSWSASALVSARRPG